MAQTRLITELVELVTPNNDDVLVIVDNTTNPSLSVTKKIKYSSLKEDLQDMIDLFVQEGTGISAVYSDAGNTLTVSVVADTTVQKTIISTGGTDVGTRQELNVIPGAGITLSGADNPSDNRVDLTVNTIAVVSGATLAGTGSPISPLGSVTTLGDGTKRLDFRGIKAGSSKISIASGDAGNTISIDVVPSGISINDLNTSAPLAVSLGGTNATTASGARANLGAAKAGANSDITELTGLTSPLSVAQGGIGADTALQGLKNLEGLKYVTSVAVAGQSLVVNDTTLVSNEYRGELRGVKAASSKISVTTDGNDIAIEANPDDILSAATQNVSLNNHRITNLATPVGSNDAATRAYVDQVSAGLIVKASVLAATTSGLTGAYLGSPNFTLTITGTGTPSIDGINITATGTSVLIKDQSTSLQNGIYTLTTAAASGISPVFTRRADSNSSSEVIAGTFTFVTSGTTNASKQFVQTALAPTLDTDALVYSVLNDATLADGSVENIKLADMSALTIKGAIASGAPQDLTANQAIGILNSGTTKFGASVLPGATTAASGIVQLYDGVDSVSASSAATANAAKTAYDAAIAASGVAASGLSAAVAASGVAASGLSVANAALPKAGGTMTGTITFASGQTINGYAPTASPEFTGAPYVNGSYRSNIVAVAALNIDCSAGNYFTKTISSNSTFTFSNVPSSRAYSFILELTHTSGTITWPAAVKWENDTAPTLNTGVTHLFMFITDDGGTRWRAAALVNYAN